MDIQYNGPRKKYIMLCIYFFIYLSICLSLLMVWGSQTCILPQSGIWGFRLAIYNFFYSLLWKASEGSRYNFFFTERKYKKFTVFICIISLKYAFNQKDIFKYHYSLSCLFVVVALATTHAAIKRKTKILITGDNVISDTTCRTQYSCDGLRRYTDMLWLDTNIHSIQVLCQYLHSYEVRGNCSFWWYVWNCWPSLFRLTFHNIQNLLSQWLDDFHTVINKQDNICINSIGPHAFLKIRISDFYY